MADVVAEQQRALRAQAQEIARRQRPDHRAGVVDDAEMPDAQPVHPPDRHIGEGIGIDHRERLAHRTRRRARASASAPRCGEHAQEVALGHDAGVARAAARDRRHAHRPMKSSRRVICAITDRQRRVRRDEPRRRRHDLAHAMPIGIGVDARPEVGERIGRSTPDTSVQPARSCSSISCRSEAVARIASPSVRMPRLRNSGTSFSKTLAAVGRVAQRGVPPGHLDVEPAGDMVEREIRERRIGDLRQDAACRGSAGSARESWRARIRAPAPRDRSRSSGRSARCCRNSPRAPATRRRTAARPQPQRRRSHGCAWSRPGSGCRAAPGVAAAARRRSGRRPAARRRSR